MNPKIKIEKAVELLPFHLTDKTWVEYIQVDNVGNNIIKLPPKEMPYDIYLFNDIGENPIIDIMASSPIDETYTGEREPIPKDLLDLINWAIKNDIRYIQFKPDDIGSYEEERLKELIEIESELPIYDLDLLKEIYS